MEDVLPLLHSALSLASVRPDLIALCAENPSQRARCVAADMTSILGQLEQVLSSREARQMTEAKVDVRKSISVVRDVAWEELHLVPWKDASVVWRDVYTLCALVDALLVADEWVSAKRPLEGDPLGDLLRRLDLALLIGGPKRSDLVTFLVDHVNHFLSTNPAAAAAVTAATTTTTTTTMKATETDAKKRRMSVIPEPEPAADWPVLRNPLPRVPAPGVVEFAEMFMKPQQPVVLTGEPLLLTWCRQTAALHALRGDVFVI